MHLFSYDDAIVKNKRHKIYRHPTGTNFNVTDPQWSFSLYTCLTFAMLGAAEPTTLSARNRCARFDRH